MNRTADELRSLFVLEAVCHRAYDDAVLLRFVSLLQRKGAMVVFADLADNTDGACDVKTRFISTSRQARLILDGVMNMIDVLDARLVSSARV